MIILAFDPSGNFEEGKGTTGWCVLNENRDIINCGQIKATEYNDIYSYTKEHTALIELYNPDYVVIEDFKLYANKAMNQINSRFETSKLIGVLSFRCNELNIPIYLQGASEVKDRWKDEILIYNKIIVKKGNKYYLNNKVISEHTRDSLRHGMHFVTFKLKKLRGNKQ